MKASEEKRYKALSPFELKNKLISMASSNAELTILNAGRGNPNWVTMTPRKAFFQLGEFAIQESERNPIAPEFGGFAEKKSIAKRFEQFIKKNSKKEGVQFLKIAYQYVCKNLKINGDDFIYEMVDGILGDHYPTPDRALINCEKILHKYLEQEMCGGGKFSGKMDLFPTEGGTAAMDYIFSSLLENHLLKKGDKIALGTPIFTPYIEIPHLNDYDLVELEVKQDANLDWQYPDTELKKLEDPKIKAFFLIHPSNPTAVMMHKKSLRKIANLVKTKRKDLIILTDDVYATFVNGFKSMIDVAPHNTILVYSFSKYFGATGWRLGVIGIHQKNIFDDKIVKLPKKEKEELKKRYSTVVVNPAKMKFIDRMVADSRSVALHHTAGLSTPQQVLMTLFSLFCLTDKKNNYKKQAQAITARRFKTLYDAVGIDHPYNANETHYYTTIDIPSLAEKRYSKTFREYLLSNYEPIDFVVRLAEEKSVVLMDGGGFYAPNMSVRISLANLPDEAYIRIGKVISELLAEYYNRFEKSKKKK